MLEATQESETLIVRDGHVMQITQLRVYVGPRISMFVPYQLSCCLVFRLDKS
jgi:hypothetical protein